MKERLRLAKIRTKLFIALRWPTCGPTALSGNGLPTAHNDRMRSIQTHSLRGLVRRRHEPIAYPPNGQQVTGSGGIVFNIAPQPHDEVVDRPGVGVFVEAPDFVQHFLPGYWLALMLDQVAQDVCFHQG